MLARRSLARRRAGTATVECGMVLMLVVVPLMIGVWEVGRLVYAQQVVANAAREGCRLAAQGKTINKFGNPTEILWGSQGAASTDPNVWDTVYQSVTTGGLPGLARTDVTITCTFGPLPPTAPTGTPTPTEPWNAVKNQVYTVEVTIPFDKVRWVNLGIVNPSVVYYKATWTMLVDDPFSIDPKMPNW